MHSSVQSISPNIPVADYADDKAILSIHSDPTLATQNLQYHPNHMEDWYTKWRFKIN